MLTDRDLIINEAQRILGEHFGAVHQPASTIHRLVMVWDRPDVVAALKRMKTRGGLVIAFDTAERWSDDVSGGTPISRTDRHAARTTATASGRRSSPQQHARPRHRGGSSARRALGEPALLAGEG
jgi:hypothetical protein